MPLVLHFLAALLTPPAAAAAAGPHPIAAQVRVALDEAAAEGFGGAVIIVQGGDTLVAAASGYADREARQPFTTETVAQIGSITKTFTGAAVAMLAAEGRLDLDATVGTYLLDAPQPGRSLRLRDIAAHRSGLADYCGGDFDPLGADALVADCLSRPLAHPPGGRHYSNLGYAVLARIVEASTGQSWESWLRERLWGPLDMESTRFRFAGADDSDFARGYRDARSFAPISQRIRPLDGADWNLRGNGGMQVSARDMMRFLTALTGDGPLPCAAARARMLSPLGEPVDGVAEGLGLFFRYDEAGRLYRVGHAGSDGIFFSYIAWFPQSGALLYFVGNNGEEEARAVLRRVLALVHALPPRGLNGGGEAPSSGR